MSRQWSLSVCSSKINTRFHTDVRYFIVNNSQRQFVFWTALSSSWPLHWTNGCRRGISTESVSLRPLSWLHSPLLKSGKPWYYWCKGIQFREWRLLDSTILCAISIRLTVRQPMWEIRWHLPAYCYSIAKKTEFWRESECLEFLVVFQPELCNCRSMWKGTDKYPWSAHLNSKIWIAVWMPLLDVINC